MKKKAILHLGHGKTATSFLQNLLVMNAKKLENFNFFVPTNFSEFGGHDLKILAKENKEFPGNAHIFFDMIKNGNKGVVQILKKTPKNKNIILSSELFFYKTHITNKFIEYLHKAGFKEIEIILFIPDYRSSVVSTYCQLIRNHQYKESCSDLLKEGMPYFRYSNYINSLKKNKNVSKIHLRPFFKDYFLERPIEKEFFGIIDSNIETQNFRFPDKPINPSLSLEDYEVIKILNEIDNPYLVRHYIANYSNLDLENKPKINAYYYTSDIKKILINDFSEEISTMKYMLTNVPDSFWDLDEYDNGRITEPDFQIIVDKLKLLFSDYPLINSLSIDKVLLDS